MKFKNLIQKIFSITNKDKHKVITFLFVKMKFKMAARPKPCVVVVDPGGIGDYMFCRPYFKYIKQSPKYKNCNGYVEDTIRFLEKYIFILKFCN